MEQPVFDDVVTGGLHLVGGGYLCQIVLAVMRVVGQCIDRNGVVGIAGIGAVRE